MSNPNTYIGDCGWDLIRFPEYNDDPPFDGVTLPAAMFPYAGDCDQTRTWRALNKVGTLYFDSISGKTGYIIDNAVKSGQPGPGLDSVDLKVFFAPDFTKVLTETNTPVKTASISANVEAAGILDGTSDLVCRRDISFYSPTAVFRYLASAQPFGPRYSVYPGLQQPQIYRATVNVTAKGGGQSINYGAQNIPLPLASALAMPVVDFVTDPDFKPIPGTPWWRCQETISRIFLADS